jgi:hypothetical protein
MLLSSINKLRKSKDCFEIKIAVKRFNFMKLFFTTLLIITLFSCVKNEVTECKCEFPFLTGNANTTFLAVNGESYWYNNQCWKYLGPTKTKNDVQPVLPGTNSAVWSLCGSNKKDCNSIEQTAVNWIPGVYYPGDIVKLNNKVYIAFVQGNPMPEDAQDDIWAILCE